VPIWPYLRRGQVKIIILLNSPKNFKNSYLFDKKISKICSHRVFLYTHPSTRTRDKTTVFRTTTKNKVEKRISFLFGHEVLFFTFYFFRVRACKLSLNYDTKEAADWDDA
jgi:hypothetical protein